MKQTNRLRRVFIAFSVCFTLGLVSVVSLQLFRSYEATLRAAETNAANLVKSMAQHAYDIYEDLDLASYGIVERLEWDNFGAGLSGDDVTRLKRLFKRQVAQMNQVHGFFVYDKDGNWIVTDKDDYPASINNSDRDYFIYHKTFMDRAIRIGTPLRSRSTGDLVVPVSRRINNPDNSFAGVFLITVNIEYFNQYYADFHLGPRDIISQALRSGEVISRLPYSEKNINYSLSKGEVYSKYLLQSPSGVARIRSVVDGIDRIQGYQALERYPVVVQVGLSRRDVLAAWITEVVIYTGGLLVMLAVLFAMGLLVLRYMRLDQEHQLELATAYEAVEKLAMEDGLTGLSNRRHFDVMLPVELNRAKRQGYPVGLIMLDVDFFKNFNDRYGHQMGDLCLQAVAQVVQKSVRRAGDLVARYGGEEIVILLPNTDEPGTHQIAMSIVEGIRALNIEHLDSPLGRVTASIGYHVVGCDGFAYSPTEALGLADQNLYEAKGLGRNRVHPAMCQS
ncbi:sensor domain-containing diguanylate cyclase [Pseudomonas sp. MAG002Y]|uniref:sensor domain-containing diguanylate cyclase n=1 Tax=Pseudomonas TaxID=286 RepID=UPI001C60D85C|nr:sensor domain-containing diguanylate cyclase [Pseudomonas sp. MAG002Y]MBW5416387.1 diguanylate cyclase [Pseudomonas sp. MAG002Y]